MITLTTPIQQKNITKYKLKTVVFNPVDDDNSTVWAVLRVKFTDNDNLAYGLPSEGGGKVLWKATITNSAATSQGYAVNTSPANSTDRIRIVLPGVANVYNGLKAAMDAVGVDDDARLAAAETYLLQNGIFGSGLAGTQS